MNLNIIKQLIKSSNIDAIVVEGYDGVGKGRLLNELSQLLKVEPYRPDYSFWDSYGLEKTDRWKISGYFWDIFSHFFTHSGVHMLFDRGIMSGAVYGEDASIAHNYKSLLKDVNVLHILVTVKSFDDFYEFQKSRNIDISIEEIKEAWNQYEKYTQRYIRYFEMSGVDYLIYVNSYDALHATHDICEGCGHYNHGYCRHPKFNCKVEGSQKRCEYSKEAEVQDR